MDTLLFTNISELLTLGPAARKAGRHVVETDLDIRRDQALFVENGKIAWIGDSAKIPKEFARQELNEINCAGQTVLPGFVECHTHTVFAGNRAEEFEMRNQGASYQEISRRGGGILSTMKKTREASEEVLLAKSQRHVDHFADQGVTTLEIKSGYALDEFNEIKMLRINRKLKGPRIVSTFLGAHAKPPEYETYGAYLKHLTADVLPKIRAENLAERVDIFVENGFFTADDARVFLRSAQALDFKVVIHADQLTLSGGALLSIELGAQSGDHLLQIGPHEIQKLAASEVTCVLLPASDLYMKCKYPPARQLIDAGAKVALATDFNPGTSPTQNLNLVGLLARLEMKMTLPEVIAAYTVGASQALDLADEIGSLSVGKSADLFCTSASWQELFYSVGARDVTSVYRGGRLITS
ncbi:MAG: imidazolonepropionase [Proteobacteria bacterium]|nr:MAG: imidazolonepropionase [Pseudomonadota bacterium]